MEATTTADDDSDRETGKNGSILKGADPDEYRKHIVSESSVKSESESDAGIEVKPTKKVSVGSNKKTVMFSVGHHSDADLEKEAQMEDFENEKAEKKKRKAPKVKSGEAEVMLRRRIGSQVKMDQQFFTEDEEIADGNARSDVASHRIEKSHSRHKISREASSHMLRVKRRNRTESQTGHTDDEAHLYEKIYGKTFDSTPHDIFVQMDELEHSSQLWVEQARWVKYEERKEVGSERWGRPHLSSLSFHSLVNLRVNFDRGITILDFEARDIANVAFKIADEFCSLNILPVEYKGDLLRMLLYKHKFVEGGGQFKKISGLKRNLSKASIGVSISLLSTDHIR